MWLCVWLFAPRAGGWRGWTRSCWTGTTSPCWCPAARVRRPVNELARFFFFLYQSLPSFFRPEYTHIQCLFLAGSAETGSPVCKIFRHCSRKNNITAFKKWFMPTKQYIFKEKSTAIAKLWILKNTIYEHKLDVKICRNILRQPSIKIETLVIRPVLLSLVSSNKLL